MGNFLRVCRIWISGSRVRWAVVSRRGPTELALLPARLAGRARRLGPHLRIWNAENPEESRTRQIGAHGVHPPTVHQSRIPRCRIPSLRPARHPDRQRRHRLGGGLLRAHQPGVGCVFLSVKPLGRVFTPCKRGPPHEDRGASGSIVTYRVPRTPTTVKLAVSPHTQRQEGPASWAWCTPRQMNSALFQSAVNAVWTGAESGPGSTRSHFANRRDPAQLLPPHPARAAAESPDEVAHAIVFLALGLASYITGATLFVDGRPVMAAKFATVDRTTRPISATDAGTSLTLLS
jgi:hypothetical protein